MMVTGPGEFNVGAMSEDRLKMERRKAAAERALAEAAARRQEIEARVAAMAPEHGAKRKAEPVRYGDWETKGIASDF